MTDLKQSGKTVNGQEVALNMRKDTRCFSSAVYVYTLRYRQKKDSLMVTAAHVAQVGDGIRPEEALTLK